MCPLTFPYPCNPLYILVALVIPCAFSHFVLSLSLSFLSFAIRCHSPLHERVPSSSIEFLMISQAAPHHVWWSFRRSGFIDEPAPVTHRMRRDGNGCMKLATHQIMSNYNTSGYRYQISKRRASAQKRRWQWGSKSAWWRWRHGQRSSMIIPKWSKMWINMVSTSVRGRVDDDIGEWHYDSFKCPRMWYFAYIWFSSSNSWKLENWKFVCFTATTVPFCWFRSFLQKFAASLFQPQSVPNLLRWHACSMMYVWKCKRNQKNP